MKIIHMIYPVIGIMLALMLCITPVVAVSGDDFEIGIYKTEPSHGHATYKYWNLNNKSEVYTYIATGYTIFLDSQITFKPANIPDAPVMVVDTWFEEAQIYLPRSVDEWEIKCYICYCPLVYDDCPRITVHSYHLTGADVINLNEFIENYKLTGGRFDKFMEKGLGFQVGLWPCLYALSNPNYYRYLP